MSRIILVDDNESSLVALRSYLVMAGKHDVDTANSGVEAETKLLAGRYDVLLFDYFVHDINGLDLLRWCRGRGISTPCIIQSAIDEVELREIEVKAIDEKLSPVATLPKIVEPLSLVLDTITLLTK